MSRRPKNNHYHYAEQFEDRRRHSKNGRTAYMPFKAVIASLVVLLMFGLVSTTFATYVSETELPYDPEGSQSLGVTVRNLKASRDVAITGARVDLASSGWSFNGDNYIYFDNTTTGWSDSYICLCIGKSSYTSVYQMSKVTNTNYYVCKLSSIGWSDASYMAIIGTSSLWGSGAWGTGNLTNATHRSAAYTGGLDASNNQRYIFTPSSSSNGCSLSLDYKGTDNSSMNTVTLKAHACYSTTGTSSSYTADNNTGGTVQITGYYFNAYNSITTSSTDETATETYNSAKTTSSKKVTFTASAADGYVFKGWYTAANGGSSVSSSATYSSYSTNSGDKEIYARFLKQYYLTVAKNPNGYTGTPSASPASSSSSKLDANTVITLSADVQTGVTFGGWTFTTSPSYYSGYNSSSNPTKIYLRQNNTATARYTLQTPTITADSLNFKYTDSESVEHTNDIVSGQYADPESTVSSATGSTSGITYSYSIESMPSGATTSNCSIQNDPTQANFGRFTATVPGNYTLRMTITDTAYGLTSSSVYQDRIVKVRPAAPAGITYTVDGWTDSWVNNETGTAYNTPAKIPINSTAFAVTATVSSPTNGYTYSWSNTAGNYSTSDGSITAISGSPKTGTSTVLYDLCTASGSALKYTADGHYVYIMNVTATYNTVESYPTQVIFYYDILSDFIDVESFSFVYESNDYQKIYANDNTYASLRAKLRVGGTTFRTVSWFSGNNINYKVMEVWTNAAFTLAQFADDAVTDYSSKPSNSDHNSTAKQETYALFGSMQYTGPKWYRVFVQDIGSGKTAAATMRLHTTVGTSSTVADRPIYYVDSTGVTHTNSRIMAFYTVESDGGATVHYQTAQVVTGKANTYRFYLPNDAIKITFAHVSKDNYILPTLNNGTLSYSVYTNHEVLMAWSPTLDLTASANENKNTYVANVAGTPNANGIYNYTSNINGGNLTTLD